MNTNDMLIEVKKGEDVFSKNCRWLLFLCERSSGESQILNQQYEPQQEALDIVLTIKYGL